MQEDQVWLLVSLKLSGEATEQELAELDVLLRQDPELGLRVDILRNVWQEKHAGFPGKKEDALNKHMQRLSNHFSEPVLAYESDGSSDTEPAAEEPVVVAIQNRRWLWIVSGAAAAVIAFFLFGGKLWLLPVKRGYIKEDRLSAQNTVSTKRGSKSKVQLPDGSQVWLNADSRITYDESFQGASREVQLTGEAYFDVVKDKEHPFVIHTSSIDIKVLGTTLNVRSYTNEKNTEAALIRGSIEITLRNSPDKKIILRPNEKLVVQNGKASVIAGKTGIAAGEDDNEPMMVLGKVHFIKKDTVASDILWVKNKLAFDGESLKNVALKIERWYDIRVVITDENLKNTQYSAVFEDESLRQVMEALRLTGNFRYSINKKEIIIRP
ncbi:MAG TPA: FecR family protein [Puia sp.]|nr:FecR family protein [Puia sp.]